MTRETSFEAYRHLVNGGRLSEAQANVYSELYAHGPMTAQELVRAMRYQHAEKRLSELRRLGVVKELAPRECNVTGRRALVWDVTRLVEPLEVPRPQGGLKARVAQLEARVRELEQQLARVGAQGA